MELDDGAGAHMRALAERERRGLDPDAHARIAARLAQQGPAVVRGARRRRRALQLTAGLCALGMAWGASRWLAPVEAPPVARRSATPAAVPLPVASRRAPRACERMERGPELATERSADAERIELGSLGTLLAEQDSAVWVDARDPCAVRVRLLAGKVSVHAADLGGGELRVVSDHGDVVVHGTVFSVARTEAELTVEVAEGRVSVEHYGRTLVPLLAAGQRARVGAGQPAVLEPLSVREQETMRARLLGPTASAAAGEPLPPSGGAAPAGKGRDGGTSAPHASAGALAQQADALWRDGQLELARARYREAGALRGPTAEAAWLALARRELVAGRAEAAQQALQGYAEHFSDGGALAAEAAGIAFRAALQRGDHGAARQQAELLTRRYAHTPQAEAAARWLASKPQP